MMPSAAGRTSFGVALSTTAQYARVVARPAFMVSSVMVGHCIAFPFIVMTSSSKWMGLARRRERTRAPPHRTALTVSDATASCPSPVRRRMRDRDSTGTRVRAPRGSSSPCRLDHLFAQRRHAQTGQEEQVLRGEVGLHSCRHGVHQRVALEPLVAGQGLNRPEEPLDVLPLPVEQGVADRRLAVTHVELSVARELALRALEVGEPGLVEAIRQIGVHAAVDQVAGEDARRALALEHPPAVVRRLAWTGVDDAKDCAPDADPLTIPDRPIGELPYRGPLLPEHGAQDDFLFGVVATDHP